jgi:hypothetical protein
MTQGAARSPSPPSRGLHMTSMQPLALPNQTAAASARIGLAASSRVDPRSRASAEPQAP